MSQTQAEGGTRRLPMLDGLRSLVILVLLVHFTDSISMPPIAMAAFYTTQFVASVGLDVFFVLSGFLITRILLQTKDAPGYFRNFYVRRVLRIVPVYYGVVFVFLILLPAAFHDFADLAVTPVQLVPYWAFLMNVANGLNWHVVGSTGHFWSLAVEEQFYVIWPAAVYFCSPTQLRRICWTSIVLNPLARLLFASWFPQTAGFHQLIRLDVLALGSLVALGIHTGVPSVSATKRRLLPAALCATLWTLAAYVIGSPVASKAGISSVSAYFGMLAFLAVLESGPASRLGRFVGAWPLRRVGMYSYAIYIFHDPLADSFSRFGWLAMPQAGVLNAVRYCLIMVPTCVGAGALSWHLYERPFLKLKDRFS